MVAISSFLVLSLIISNGSAAIAAAASSSDMDGKGMDGYKAHPDIKVKWRFMDRNSFPIDEAPFARTQQSPSKYFYKLPMKQPTAILLSLRNLGESAFNISSIQGSLHAAHRYSFHVQNNPLRSIQSILAPHSELTFEYQFVPLPELAAFDYVFSGDIRYKLLQREGEEYNYNFVNVTVNFYDYSTPFKLIDFELLFMLISMAIFQMFLGILFYELWWFPNQLAQGYTPLPTQEWVLMIYKEYALTNYYAIKSKIMQTPNPMDVARKSGSNGIKDASFANVHGGGDNKRKSKNDNWLSGTSVANKKKKKKKN